MKNRITTFIIAIFLMFSAAACSNSPESMNNSDSSASSFASESRSSSDDNENNEDNEPINIIEGDGSNETETEFWKNQAELKEHTPDSGNSKTEESRTRQKETSQASVASRTEENNSRSKETSQASATSRTEENNSRSKETSRVSVTSRTEENNTRSKETSHASVTPKTEESSNQQQSKTQSNAKVKVPDVVGKTEKDALSSLKAAGLKVSTTEGYSDTVASGRVVSQLPSSGNYVAKNSTITIKVSKGKKPITVTCGTSTITVYKGSPYGNLPTPTKDYYKFVGWYTSATGGTQITSSTKVSNSSNHTLYAHWTSNSTSGWVLASEVPSGAKIVDQKWKYTYTTYSDRWEWTGGGTYYFGSFPDGYNTSDRYYWMNRGALTKYENNNTRRDVGNSVFNSYVFWHWASPWYSGDGNHLVDSHYGVEIRNSSGEHRGYATVWEAFESTSPGEKIYNDGTYVYKGQSGYSWHWWRIDIYKQDYNEYKKVTDSSSSERESTTEVKAGGNVSNVRKYVRYKKR